MKNKISVKNCVVLAIVVVLIVVTAVFMAKPNENYAGAGKGTNAKITSMDEFADFMHDLSSDLHPRGTYSASAYAAENGEEEREKKYTSYTVRERTRSTASYSDSSSSDSYKIKMSLQRDLTIYVTENATFYDSWGILSSRSKLKSDTNRVDFQFHVLIYTDAENVFMNFKRYNISASSSSEGETDEDEKTTPINFDCVLNRWINFSDDSQSGAGIVASEMTSINNENLEIFALIGNYTEHYKDDFIQSGKTYEMSEATFKSFASGLLSIAGVSSSFGEDEDFSGSFELDLGSPTRPEITLTYKYEYKQAEAAEVDEFAFENINNTVIKDIPATVDAMSSKEFTDRVMQTEE